MQTPKEILNIVASKKLLIWNIFLDRKKFKTSEFKEFKRHEMNTLILLAMDEPSELVCLLEMPLVDLEAIVNSPSYHSFAIKKKKGGERIIHAPATNLKRLQQRLNYCLQAYYLCIKPSEVHGFVIQPNYLGKHCNIVANAQPHIGKQNVLNIDLQDFFPSIAASRVMQMFSDSTLFNFNEEIATALTLLCTYEGRLPIGAPTSPAISNFICLRLDEKLIEFAKNNSLVYTRYADDLTFSSDEKINSDMVLDIINIIKQHDFNINSKKLRLATSNKKQTVTGITVNEKINVDRKLLKKTRAMLHDLSTNGIDAAVKKHFKVENIADDGLPKFFIHRLEGYINFIGQVRGKSDLLYCRMKREFDLIFKFSAAQ